MKYHFFDYKYNIQGFDSDLFSPWHIAFIVFAFIFIPFLAYLLRKTDRKKIDIFLKVLSVFVVLLEISKIIWESYYDIKTGRGFNAGGILPFYSCDLLIFCLLFAAWGKGKAKDVALSWLCTVGICCGVIGTIYTNGLNWYPFWTYGAWDSILFHFNLFMVGVVLLANGYKKLEWKDIFRAWIPMLLLAIIAIPSNYEYGGDYMQIHSADGVPLMSSLAELLAKHHLRPVFTFIMLSSYLLLAAAVFGIYKLVGYIHLRISEKMISHAKAMDEIIVPELLAANDRYETEMSEEAERNTQE